MRIRVLALVALSALLVAGCADGEPVAEDDAPTTSSAASTTTSEAASSSAPAPPPVTLKVGLPRYPRALTDEQGRAVYAFSGDDNGAVTCLDACAEQWPPVLTGDQPTVVGTDFDSAGTQPRGDGTLQATYASWPLYYFAGDTAPGDAKGIGQQSFGGSWFLMQDNGNRLG